MGRPFAGGTFSCETCGDTFKRSQTKVRLGYTRFCNNSCAAKGRTGAHNHQWVGGYYINENGYKRVRVGSRYLYEHRHKVEESLGHRLRRDEDVHHISGDKLDNNLDNLVVLSKSQHASIHGRRA